MSESSGPREPYAREYVRRRARAVGLSGRELEVIRLLFEGVTRRGEIAARLSVSERTVGNHFQRIFKRTGVHGTTELLSYFMPPMDKLEINAERETWLVMERLKMLGIVDLPTLLTGRAFLDALDILEREMGDSPGSGERSEV